MGKFKELDIEVAEAAERIIELPREGLDHLAAVLVENHDDIAEILFVSLQVNIERVKKGLQNEV